MDNVVDLRPKTPPSAADVEATVTAALTDLIRRLAPYWFDH
jgi:hypothetical protein